MHANRTIIRCLSTAPALSYRSLPLPIAPSPSSIYSRSMSSITPKVPSSSSAGAATITVAPKVPDNLAYLYEGGIPLKWMTIFNGVQASIYSAVGYTTAH
jgi:hypothetical protein